MTAQDKALRKARKSIVRAERAKRIKEYRERKRRREIARQGIVATKPTPAEPTYAATRGAKFTCWCIEGGHSFLSESCSGEVNWCHQCKGEE